MRLHSDWSSLLGPGLSSGVAFDFEFTNPDFGRDVGEEGAYLDEPDDS